MRFAAVKPCSRRSSTGSAAGQLTGRCCRGSAPRPAETAPAAQRAALIGWCQVRVHRQHGRGRAGRGGHVRHPRPAARPERLGRPDDGHLHVVAFGWLILPIVAFGLDSTLDPATLALYPLRTQPLAVGLLAASAAGAWPLAN